MYRMKATIIIIALIAVLIAVDAGSLTKKSVPRKRFSMKAARKSIAARNEKYKRMKYCNRRKHTCDKGDSCDDVCECKDYEIKSFAKIDGKYHPMCTDNSVLKDESRVINKLVVPHPRRRPTHKKSTALVQLGESQRDYISLLRLIKTAVWNEISASPIGIGLGILSLGWSVFQSLSSSVEKVVLETYRTPTEHLKYCPKYWSVNKYIGCTDERWDANKGYVSYQGTVQKFWATQRNLVGLIEYFTGIDWLGCFVFADIYIKYMPNVIVEKESKFVGYRLISNVEIFVEATAEENWGLSIDPTVEFSIDESKKMGYVTVEFSSNFIYCKSGWLWGGSCTDYLPQIYRGIKIYGDGTRCEWKNGYKC